MLHRSKARPRSASPVAFTLAEILIVMALFVTIGMLVSQSLVSGTKEFSALTGDMDLNRQALKIIGEICRDIRGCGKVQSGPNPPIDDSTDLLMLADPTYRLQFTSESVGHIELALNKRDPTDPQQQSKPWLITWLIQDKAMIALAGGSQIPVYKLHRQFADDNGAAVKDQPEQVFPSANPKDPPNVAELVFACFKSSRSLVRVRLKLETFRQLPHGVSVPAYVAEVESSAHLRDQGGD